MDGTAHKGILRAFAQLKDPRMNRTKLHSLTDILAIAILAVICGADGWTQVAKFGRCKRKWFKTFLELPNGIPSHDTFGRVFAALDPAAFEECFMKWIAALTTASAGRLIAIDGKTIRRSLDTASDTAAIHMVNAWCQANHMVLGQLATAAKSNEITAIPQLMKLLDLQHAVVTIDAAGCQKKIAQQIVAQGGDYILQLKGNQGTLHKETVELFDQCLTDDCHGIAYRTAKTTDKGHGRIEERRIWTTSEVNWFAEKAKWKIGTAVFDKSRCLPWARGEECLTCEEQCPLPEKAISHETEEVINLEWLKMPQPKRNRYEELEEKLLLRKATPREIDELTDMPPKKRKLALPYVLRDRCNGPGGVRVERLQTREIK